MRVIGLAGWSGAGKTTLLVRLIPELTRRGLKVSTLKHAHHEFEIDRPGKDSTLHREAGAKEVLISSSRRFAIIHELRGGAEPELSDLLRRLAQVDLVVVEGFKQGPQPKIEVHRAANGQPFLYPTLNGIVAVATDARPPGVPVPTFRLDDIPAIAGAAMSLSLPADEIMASSGVRAGGAGTAGDAWRS